jgi:2-polyprenyl-3-methyl-5-hydroxy-6-metoxy-1,4-benzoquinol methylase
MKHHKDNGITKILELPYLFNLWQTMAGSENAKRKIIREYVLPFEGARILDIGCGTGVALGYILEQVKSIEYVGYDINSEYINFAKEQYKSKGQFYSARVDEFNNLHNHFDLVMSLGVLHHLDDKESGVLIESAKKTLKKDGCFILAEPVWTNRQSFLEKILMKRDRGQNIRDEQSYLNLLASYFSKTDSIIREGMLNIPWTISITKSYNL